MSDVSANPAFVTWDEHDAALKELQQKADERLAYAVERIRDWERAEAARLPIGDGAVKVLENYDTLSRVAVWRPTKETYDLPDGLLRSSISSANVDGLCRVVAKEWSEKLARQVVQAFYPSFRTF